MATRKTGASPRPWNTTARERGLRRKAVLQVSVTSMVDSIPIVKE
jgi:hypothetical protein